MQYKPRFRKLLVPANLFHLMRFHLSRFGVNSSTLFPDLEGLCKHIEWSNSILKDEKGDKKEEIKRMYVLFKKPSSTPLRNDDTSN